LIDQGLQLLARFGTILHRGTNLIEEVQSLCNLTLSIGRVGTLLRSHGLTGDASIAGVQIAERSATAIGVTTGRTGDAVAHRTRLASAAALTCLRLPAGTLAAALTTLTTLTTLTLLSTLAAFLTTLTTLTLLSTLAAFLTTLTGLAAAAGLTLSSLRVGPSAEAGELVAQTGQIVHGAVERGVGGSALSIAHGARRVADLLTQLLHVASEAGFGRIGELTATQPIRTALQAGTEIVFVHAIECTPQLAGSRGLRGSELACRVSQLLGKVRQVIGHLLAIVDHFVDFLGGGGGLLLAGGVSGILPGDQVAHAIGLLLLPGRQLLGCLGHRVEAAGGVLLLHATKQVGGFAQAVGGSAGIGGAGILGSGSLHVVLGLAQAVERLLGGLLAAIGLVPVGRWAAAG
jgi:hypothetical protein